MFASPGSRHWSRPAKLTFYSAERGADCAKPSAELLPGRIFGGGGVWVTRFQKAWPRGWVSPGSRPRMTDFATEARLDHEQVRRAEQVYLRDAADFLE